MADKNDTTLKLYDTILMQRLENNARASYEAHQKLLSNYLGRGVEDKE